MTVLGFMLDPTAAAFREDFARNRAVLPGYGLGWLEARRRAGMDAFARTGVPTRRVEAWKYSDLAAALESALEPASAFAGEVPGLSPLGEAAGAHVVVADGVLRQCIDAHGIELIDLGGIGERVPDWVTSHLGIMAAGADQPMGAASLALMRGGVAARVRGTGVLNLDFFHSAQRAGTVAHARVLIVVEEGAALRLLESHTGAGTEQVLANIGVELVLKAGAKLEHVRLQAAGPGMLHVTSLGASLAQGARYRALHAALGARLARLDANIRLDAPGAHAVVHSISVLDAGSADITTVMDHASPHTTSRQLFKNVVGGRGRAVNQGRVVVREGAVKSDSHQLFKSLLLSPQAEADAKPELEIFADDVICGHGTAIGDLDKDALFYLRARGIGLEEAKGLLIRAFLEEAIDGFTDEAAHIALWRWLDGALDALGSAAA